MTSAPQSCSTKTWLAALLRRLTRWGLGRQLYVTWARTWSTALFHRLAQRGFDRSLRLVALLSKGSDRPLRLASLLSRDLVGRSGSQACLAKDLIVCFPAQGCSTNGPEGGRVSTLGTLFPDTRQLCPPRYVKLRQLSQE